MLRLLEQIPHFLCCPGYSRGGSSRQAHGQGWLSSRCLCRGGWKHHPANLRGTDWELGYPPNSACFSFSGLQSPTHVCFTWWKTEFPWDLFSQHTAVSHGSSNPWKAGTAAQRSCQSWTVQGFGPVQPEELKSATWLSARLPYYSIVSLWVCILTDMGMKVLCHWGSSAQNPVLRYQSNGF